MEKIAWDGPKWGSRGMFPTNPDLADILGRTDLDLRICISFLFFGPQISGCPGPQISKFPDFQVPRFPDAAAAGRTLRSQPDFFVVVGIRLAFIYAPLGPATSEGLTQEVHLIDKYGFTDDGKRKGTPWNTSGKHIIHRIQISWKVLLNISSCAKFSSACLTNAQTDTYYSQAGDRAIG